MLSDLPIEILMPLAVVLVFSLVIHEFAHAWTALQLGDPTARDAGRVTLNPLVHLDFIGTIMLFLIGFGYAKPVPVNIGNLRNRYLGDVLVSLAGPLSNLLLGFIALMLLLGLQPEPATIPHVVLSIAWRINIILAVFNLLPFFPLDGSHLVASFLDYKGENQLRQNYIRYSGYAFFALIVLDFVAQIRIFGYLIGFAINSIETIFGL
jgi:Zn-dependent protease